MAKGPKGRLASAPKGHARPSWDEYFLSITRQVATRSTCVRRHVGAILVHGKRILCTGYNGAPRGVAHCVDRGCLREQLGIPSGQQTELCRGLHAEMNALLQAAAYGIVVSGATLYSTHFPCSLCAKMLINTGIERIVVAEDYPDGLAKDLLREAAVRVELFETAKARTKVILRGKPRP
jgi:dCMP deaminase